MSALWYALNSKPMKEAFLSTQLALRRLESYFPAIRVKPVNPRARKIKPYFPGYVFARIDLEHEQRERFWFPGLAGVVSFDGIPSAVPDSLMDTIRRKVDQINASGVEPLSELQPGDTVRIQSGPFSGYEAILDARLSGAARVRLLLMILNKPHMSLELPLEQIQPTKQ
jgi:transcriptional antiterminator RfaH